MMAMKKDVSCVITHTTAVTPAGTGMAGQIRTLYNGIQHFSLPEHFDSRGTQLGVIHSLDRTGSSSRALALLKMLRDAVDFPIPEEGTKLLLELIRNYLTSLNISYDVIQDKDGYFIFPKGAEELDDALVSEPLEWLNEYPQTRTEFVQALKEYSNLTDENASDVADKFRKALERFFQEFFSKNGTLENLKKEYGSYMKGKGVPSELSNNLEALLQAYTNFMNGYAKHHSKTNKNLLEYIMYQTGNIIRFVITLKKED